MNNAHNILADLLRLAAENGLPTQTALASAAGMKRPLLTDYVRGAKDPGLSNFLRLCDSAGVEVILKNKATRQPK